ncbi:hypothetical protein [Silvibacterium acidisoli]|uniref:hypothetical protein n=1 Tax=Acidobacteriaceae bacterium ZG23-2 TaxID=2883246 RepID=UPI00406D1E18
MAARLFRLPLVLLLCSISATLAFADPAPFDLAGPKLEVRVTRGGQTLSITKIPNLAVGDRLWIKADFPQAQSAHYLLVAAFLRGSTNPPPENWFTKAETWNKKFIEQGGALNVTVPEGAQQVLLFLVPETSGDYKTLIGAVRGRPGSFVRASQDLNQANLDRTRLDVYMDTVRKLNSEDPEKLKTVSPLLARSLSMQLDKNCLQQDLEQLAPCLTQKQDSLILNDGHSTSIVEAVTGGPAGDLVLQASYTPQASYGYYSPYISSIVDIARIMDSFRTAVFQYIPALASMRDEALNLKLNTPPSFHNPKSVIVVALPAVEAAQPPPLHPIDEKQIFCAQKNDLILPADGAPLVFSTNYARDLVLQLKTKDGKQVELPLKPDAAQGGFVVDTKPLGNLTLGQNVDASVHGLWGFEPFHGPTFHLQGAREQQWQIASADQEALVVGRDDTIHLQADDASCVDSILFKSPQGTETKADFKLVKPNEVEVKLPLKDSQPGSLTLTVKQAGLEKPQEVSLHTFAEAGHLENFSIHAGDNAGLLKGSRLDEVASLSLQNITFVPGKLSSSQGSDELPMQAKDAKAVANLKAGSQMKATVTLKDGRKVDLSASVDASRPQVVLLGRNVGFSNGDGNSSNNIQLSDQNELPQNSKLTFSLKAQTPENFSRQEKIEVATEDGSYSTMLSMGNGTLTLQDSKTALATLDPSKAFGGSAFGPLHFRLIDGNGVAGDWQPLATLVRLPELKELKCPSPSDQPCKLTGSDLFLVDSVAGDPQFTHPVQVPDGFPGSTLPVPHPGAGNLYVKLRDDPTVVNQVTLTAQSMPALKEHAASAPPNQSRPDYVRPSPATPAPAAAPAQPPADTQPKPATPDTTAPQTPPPAAPQTTTPPPATPQS